MSWQEQVAERRESLRSELQSSLSELQQRVARAGSTPLGDLPGREDFQPILDRVEGLVDDPQLDETVRLAATPELERARGQIRDREMLERLENLLIEGATNSDRTSWQRMDEDYEQAFRDYGIDVWKIPFETALQRIRSSTLQIELADALELWMSTRSVAQANAPSKKNPSLPTWLSLILAVDEDPLRTRQRRVMYSGAIDLMELRAIREATDFDGSTPRSLSWLASAFSTAGSTAEALEILKQAALRYLADPMLRDDYALTLSVEHRWQEAARHYSAAVSLRPRSGGLWRSLARVLNQLGQVDEARDALLQAVRLQPSSGATHLELAEIDLKRGDFTQAAQALARAMQLDPELPSSHGILYRLLGIDDSPNQKRQLRRCATALDERLGSAQPNACRDWLQMLEQKAP